ncbi:MAG: enoyl-CoA hydratase/isomerase family protein [Deltaproteobacteria bacterium]|jgi:enoyl-CoA hydratase|nr:enoyl-CoA hydratase/isomerase family protein [Deltaproteobacteria bacterium]
MEFANLLFERKDSIVLITMNRPSALNALNDATLRDLNKALDAIQEDAGIKGVIITGGGKAFVAGADISQMVDYTSEQCRVYMEFAQKTFSRIEEMGKPFIAAVNGFALGGGCELAMSCDIRILSDKANFGQPEINLGIIPGFGGTQRLPRLVGPGLAKEMIYTGRMVKAEEALAIGLANKVVPAETLLDEAFAMMRDIVSKSAIALRYAKVAINCATDNDLYKGLELEKDLESLCFATADQKEGCRAFLEKRPAKFTDK